MSIFLVICLVFISSFSFFVIVFSLDEESLIFLGVLVIGKVLVKGIKLR